jgi:cytochrome c biogenesis protein CcdA
MEELLSNLLESSNTPLFSALILGLLTAISPCPLATNITAIGFISKDIKNRNRVFYSGLIYTTGRIIGYTSIALIIYLGADQFSLSGWFQQYGERIIGPLLIIIGIFMLGLIKINLPALGNLTQKIENKKRHNYLDALLLGVLFSLAFCPYSGVLFFGMLIPMTITSASGLFLPVAFAFATGIPVIIFAWLIAYTISGVGKLYNKLKNFEFWLRRIIAVLFIGVGIYYINQVYF